MCVFRREIKKNNQHKFPHRAFADCIYNCVCKTKTTCLVKSAMLLMFSIFIGSNLDAAQHTGYRQDFGIDASHMVGGDITVGFGSW